ncbi:hypothetical protein AB3R30_05180 [Leptolyngbyaceae cyanobacterium UHCC 1019]
MNAIAKVTLNALMIVAVVSPFVIATFSPTAEVARPSGKPGRLDPGGSRAVTQNWLQEFKG